MDQRISQLSQNDLNMTNSFSFGSLVPEGSIAYCSSLPFSPYSLSEHIRFTDEETVRDEPAAPTWTSIPSEGGTTILPTDSNGNLLEPEESSEDQY